MRGSEVHFDLHDAEMQCSKRRDHETGTSSAATVDKPRNLAKSITVE
jgi:hypothetical protein